MHTGAIEVMIYIVNSSEEPRSCKSRNYHPLLQAIWAGQRSRFRKKVFFFSFSKEKHKGSEQAADNTITGYDHL